MKKVLDCMLCGTPVHTNNDVVSAICSECIIETMWSAPPKTEKKKKGYPKGWRFMNLFVHVDGTVYHKGVEQPDLKDSLPATDIIVKPKKSAKEKKQEKADIAVKVGKLKKELKAETRKTHQKKLEIQIKKLQAKL